MNRKKEQALRVEFFQKIFPNFKSIHKKYPALWPIGAYHAWIRTLKKYGFDDAEDPCIPEKMIASWPPILDYPVNILKKRISDLKKSKFKDPHKMIRKVIRILTYTEDGDRRRIEGFKKFGFNNPLKLMEEMPQILGYGLESCWQKIHALGAYGFSEPAILFEKMPELFGSDISRTILPKVRYYQRTLGSVRGVTFVTRYTNSLGCAHKRMSLVMRVLYDRKLPVRDSFIFSFLIDPKKFIRKTDLQLYPKTKRLFDGYYKSGVAENLAA